MKKIIYFIFNKYNNSVVLKYQKLGGYSNKNYKITTDKGIFFLKFYANNYSEVQIKEVITKLNKLNKSYLPKMHFGKLNDNTIYSIMNYIYAQNYNHTDTEIKNAAKILAKFHNNVKKINIKNYVNFEIYKFSPHYGNLKEDIKIRKYKKKYHQNYKPIKSKMQWIHRDFSTDNVLFKNKKAVAIIDFDIIAYGQIEYDLVHAVISFSVDRTKKNYSFNLDIIKIFVKEYTKHININLDFKNIYLFFMFILLKGAIYNNKQYVRNRENINLLICRYYIKLLDEFFKNKKDIKAAFLNYN